jgi:predicted alpha/beta-fold hydrolase
MNFTPPRLLKGGVRQTLYGYFSNKHEVPRHENLVVDLDSSESLICNIDHPHLPDSAPILILFHGLGGCSESPYLLSISKSAEKLGIRVVRFNHRGCGAGGKSLAKEIYHSGRILDLLATTKKISSKYQEAPIYLCGFSLSGNMLLSLLAKKSDQIESISNIKAAMSVCPPLDLEKSSIKMTEGKNRIFDLYFGKRLISELRSLEKVHGYSLLIKGKTRINLREFDKVYTAPLAGYGTREEYYKDNSSKYWIQNIKLPTKILAAFDDPIIDNSDLLNIDLPSSISLDIQKHGGHMGFINRHPIDGFGKRWMDFQIINWIRNHIAK